MKKLSIYFFSIIAVALMTVSCKSSKNALPSLEGKWNIVSVNGQAVSLEETPFVEFMPENRIHSQLGCNIFNTNYQNETGSEALSFEDGQRTMMMCPNMAIEDAILKALLETKKYQTNEDGISFVNAEGQTVLNLVQSK